MAGFADIMSMVLYSRTTRWRGPYYQFCLAKLDSFFSSSRLLLGLLSQLMMFFFHSFNTKKNHSEKTYTQTYTFTTTLKTLDVVDVLGPNNDFDLLVKIFGPAEYVLKNVTPIRATKKGVF